MPLQVLAGPGCDAAGKDAYVAKQKQPDDVVISVGRIYERPGRRRLDPVQQFGPPTDGPGPADHGDPLRA